MDIYSVKVEQVTVDRVGMQLLIDGNPTGTKILLKADGTKDDLKLTIDLWAKTKIIIPEHVDLDDLKKQVDEQWDNLISKSVH